MEWAKGSLINPELLFIGSKNNKSPLPIQFTSVCGVWAPAAWNEIFELNVQPRTIDFLIFGYCSNCNLIECRHINDMAGYCQLHCKAIECILSSVISIIIKCTTQQLGNLTMPWRNWKYCHVFNYSFSTIDLPRTGTENTLLLSYFGEITRQAREIRLFVPTLANMFFAFMTLFL